jgi:hypothetical protein
MATLEAVGGIEWTLVHQEHPMGEARMSAPSTRVGAAMSASRVQRAAVQTGHLWRS